MKNILKTTILSIALLTASASAQQAVEVEESLATPYSNLEPGYAETIDMASVPALDETVDMFEEFDDPTLFMSDAGVYRYAYYEKTGVWLSRAEAKAAIDGETPAEMEW